MPTYPPGHKFFISAAEREARARKEMNASEDFVFVRISDDDGGAWLLKVTSPEDLAAYMLAQTHTKDALRVWMAGAMQRDPDLAEDGKAILGEDWPSTPGYGEQMSSDKMLAMSAQKLADAEANGDTSRPEAFRLGRTGIDGMSERITYIFMADRLNAVLRGETILINKNGGWSRLANDADILDVEIRDRLVFPDDDHSHIRILSWPGGKHFYAKVGATDVVVGGEQKWNSRKEAVAAAESYIREAAASARAGHVQGPKP